MNEETIKDLLKQVKSGTVSVDDALRNLKNLPFEDIGYAKIDHHRQMRNGYPEVIYSEGKTIKQFRGIVETMLAKDSTILATRADKEKYVCIADICEDIKYYEEARIIVINAKRVKKSEHKILVVTGGTSDIPVAEEAAITAETFGNTVDRLYDVGVAGIHRLLSNIDKLKEARVVIAVAGMEGALASVVGGLVDKPVIAVPTSVGYGANLKGITTLLAMLNSCASGIGVVNIDNGFGAGYLASTINKL
ncbi:nickel pincer cofactor biosynthesis protein LarB [Clostridiaceae bacterium M8S5]|nr:nickel pincer cofactor biosynthesis protein LarB [Clostridiaceae bacterium M8S5]